MQHIRTDMSDWSSHSRTPISIWKILSKENPNLEKSYFLLSNGNWNIARLNDALSIHEENNLKKATRIHQLQQQSILVQQTQQTQQTQQIQQIQQIQNQQIMVQMAKSNKVNFGVFNIAVAFYFLSAIFQLLVILIIVLGDMKLQNALGLITISFLMMWISVPLMSKSLATQIKKLDRKIE